MLHSDLRTCFFVTHADTLPKIYCRGEFL